MDQSKIERQKIGLLYLSTYAEWAGGLIYVQNIIRALKFLDDRQKPEILLFHGYDAPVADVKAIDYPYIVFHQVSSPNRITKAYLLAKRLLTGKSAFYHLLPEIVYPYNPKIFLGKSRIDWIPDFQDRYLPHMFSESELAKRKNQQTEIARSGGTVVFSSANARDDFEKFYPDHNCTLKLMRFSSILPEYKHADIHAIKQKFGIGDVYFMSPNQFWKHKNHQVVLEALNQLKATETDFQVVFTGSPSDPRNNEYFQNIQQFVAEHGIAQKVKFLGFIDRVEQLSLMKHARAIIQPSLFEGWSTVVEDTKAMSQYILLSDIPVHREQIHENCTFFDPANPQQLAERILGCVDREPEKLPVDYDKKIREFSMSVLQALTH